MAFSRLRKFLSHHDIADNLTTNDASKVLSAKQGKALADMIANFRLPDGYSKTYSGNANDVKENSVYFCNGGVTNVPETYGHLITFCVNENVGSQIFTSYNKGTLYYRGLTSGVWSVWSKCVKEETSTTDITSQSTALNGFVLNSVMSYKKNGVEYIEIRLHFGSGSIPLDTRYSVCRLPDQYGANTILYVSTIGNNLNNFSGNTISAVMPGFFRSSDKNVVLDLNRGIVANGQTLNALLILLQVAN